MEDERCSEHEIFKGLQPPSEFMVIGCGQEGLEVIEAIQNEYQADFEDIKMVTYDRIVNYDYLKPLKRASVPVDQPQESQAGLEVEEQLSVEPSEEPQELESAELHLTFREKFSQFFINIRNAFTGKSTGSSDDAVTGTAKTVPEVEKKPDTESKPSESDKRLESGEGAQITGDPIEDIGPELDVEQEVRMLIRQSSEELQNIDVTFLICSLNSELGIDNAEIISHTASELGVLSIMFIELPEKFEKIDQVHVANRVLQKLRLIADIVVIVPEISKLGLDYVVRSIQELIKLITIPGLVNLDLADLKIIVKGGNLAMLGFGEGKGESKLEQALEATLHSPLLQVDLEGVEKALVNVTGGEDMTLEEAEGASNAVRKKIKPKSRIIFGVTVDPAISDTINIMLMVGVTPMQVLIDVYAQS